MQSESIYPSHEAQMVLVLVDEAPALDHSHIILAILISLTFPLLH